MQPLGRAEKADEGRFWSSVAGPLKRLGDFSLWELINLQYRIIPWGLAGNISFTNYSTN